MITERKLEAACMKVLEEELKFVLLWKIHNLTEGGLPDLEIAWHGHTTKIEFKLLKGNETIHDKWEDERQLLKLVRYEQQTQRAWAVAFRKGDKKGKDGHRDDCTLIYKPTALLNKELPSAQWVNGPNWVIQLTTELWNRGAVVLEGFNHHAIAELVRQTHV